MENAPSTWVEDILVLTKAKLSLLVVLTTAAGFLSGLTSGGQWVAFLHTIFGTSLAAFGAAVFNQLMEMEADRRMRRTEDRPLPAGRVTPAAAFCLGWVLCSAGVVHLGIKVNATAAFLTELTLGIYLFVYTPLKRCSTMNTLVGAVSGAIPPVIGWTAAGRPLDSGALWWFSLLFFWQIPHFYAINWIHREEYQRAGFVMLANRDESGWRTGWMSFVFAVLLMALGIWAPLIALVHGWSSVALVIAGGYLTYLAWKFLQKRDRGSARHLFLGSLLYLPVALMVALAGRM